MTVLVTGGAGYIGSHMVLALIDAGQEVVVLDNLSTGFPWMVHSKAHFVQGDCGDEGLVSELIQEHGVDAIAHFAGSIVVPDFGRRSAGLLFQQYGEVPGVDQRCHQEQGWSVHLLLDRSGLWRCHGKSHLRGDGTQSGLALWHFEIDDRDDAARHGGRSPSQLCGPPVFQRGRRRPERPQRPVQPTSDPPYQGSDSAALGERTHIDVFGNDYPTQDGTCIRDYIHVSDLANAHMLALDHLRSGGESTTLNCGYGRGYSVLQVVEAVKQVSGIDFEVRQGDRRSGDPAILIAGAERIRETLGWKPILDDLATIIAHTLAWEESLKNRKAAAA